MVICSLNRPEKLKNLLHHLDLQTFTNFETIIIDREAPLVECRDEGWRKARGTYVVFFDDDVEPFHDYLENILKSFKWDDEVPVVGVSGPTIVPNHYLKNRDAFRDDWLGKLYRWFFMGDKAMEPGLILPCGIATIGANFPIESNITKLVDFLEPSAFAVRRSTMEQVGGFDKGFGGVAEWSDVDACFRMKKFGYLIWNPKCEVFHKPEKGKTYNKRLDTDSRYRNFLRFSKRHLKPTFKGYLYRVFLWTYFKLKGLKCNH